MSFLFVDTENIVEFKNFGLKPTTVENRSFNKTYINKNKIKNLFLDYKSIKKLQDIILGCIDYQNKHNLFTKSFPEEIKIKFDNISIFNRFLKSPLARANINRDTIHISSNLLFSEESHLILALTRHLGSSDSMVEVIFLHELSHLLFKNKFLNIVNKIYELEKKITSPKDSIYYQVLSAIEENFCDGLCAWIHQKKHNLGTCENYINARNETIYSKTQNHDINIYFLNEGFKKIDYHIDEPDIEKICQIILKLSVENSLSLLSLELTDKLRKELNINSNERIEDIIFKEETLFINKVSQKSLVIK